MSQKNILLFGVGKIGRNTCENLIKHTQNKHITLINRTREKAEQVAGKFNVVVKDFADLQTEISKADVLVVATGAATPTVHKNFINPDRPILILDLSIPKNVAEEVAQLSNVTLLHMDELSKRKDEALERRKEAIPQALAIIRRGESRVFPWVDNRKICTYY